MHSEIEAIKLSCMAYTDDPTDTGMKVQNLIKEEPQLEHILKEDGKVEVNPQLGEWQEKDALMRS